MLKGGKYMNFIFLILGITSLIFGNFSNTNLENFYCETFYTENTWESSNHNDKYVKLVEIDVDNTDIYFESVDYDEGVLQIFGENFENNFIINKNGNTLYVKSNNNECRHCRFDIDLPAFYNNDVKFNIKSSNGNVFFSGKINVGEIFCEVINGNILGDSLIANKIDFKTDPTYSQSFIELISKT